MKQFLLLLFLLSSLISYGQTSYMKLGEGAPHQFRVHLDGNRGETYDYDDIEGSPYIAIELVKGKIFEVGNKNTYSLPLRYNAYADHIEYLQNGKIMVFTNPFFLSKAEFSGDTYVFKLMGGLKGGKKGSFFIQLYLGEELELLKKQSISFTPEEVAKSSYSENKPPRFNVLEEKFYLQFGEEIPMVLPRNRKKIAEFLERKGYRVKDFIKEEKLNLKAELDLKRLIEFCDQNRE